MKQIRFHTKQRKERRTRKGELRGLKCHRWRAKVRETLEPEDQSLQMLVDDGENQDVWKSKNRTKGRKSERKVQKNNNGSFPAAVSGLPKWLNVFFLVTFQPFKWIKKLAAR